MFKRKCEWTLRKDSQYITNCGKQFYDATETGAPVTDWINYCPFCGKKLTLPEVKND